MFNPVAPIAIFAFRRPSALKRVLDSLLANASAIHSDVTVFVDGPRHAGDVDAVEAVHAIAHSTVGFQSVTVVSAETNIGLSRSLVQGINRILAERDRVIVIEDDIVVAPHFLSYMNDHLELYVDDESVASIHGYVYPHTKSLPPTFFIKGADCWGWGTWRRAWQHFNSDGQYLLDELRRRKLVRKFDFEGTAPYEEMLLDQLAGRNDSWAVRWYASALLDGMYTLYPSQPMAINIGEDGSGTHKGRSTAFDNQLVSVEPIPPRRIPVTESFEGREAFKGYFRSRHRIPTSRVGRLAWRGARRLRSVLSVR